MRGLNKLRGCFHLVTTSEARLNLPKVRPPVTFSVLATWEAATNLSRGKRWQGSRAVVLRASFGLSCVAQGAENVLRSNVAQDNFAEGWRHVVGVDMLNKVFSRFYFRRHDLV